MCIYNNDNVKHNQLLAKRNKNPEVKNQFQSEQSQSNPDRTQGSTVTFIPVEDQAKHSSNYVLNYLLRYICFSNKTAADRWGQDIKSVIDGMLELFFTHAH